MRMKVVPLGLLLALAWSVNLSTAAPEPRQVMEKKDKKEGPQRSRFFELFSVQVDPQIIEDELLLNGVKVATDGPALLKYLGGQIPTDKDRARLEPLIKNLTSGMFKVREQARKDLTKEGPLALPLLRPLLSGTDLETSRRAEQIIAAIELKFASVQSAAAVRLLRERKPAGAIPLLLNYLPYSPNDLVEDEVVTTVLTLALDAKKIDQALVAALKDAVPSRRAVAALVIGRMGDAGRRAGVRKLLADKEAVVRFRAAQGLLCARDKSGMPVLVALLADAPFRYAELAEDLLQRIAGAGAPQTALADSKAARAKGHEAWRQWWQNKEAQFDLAKTDTDLFFSNVQQQAKDVTRQFLNSILKGDFKLFQKSTDVPFTFVGQMSFSTRDELDVFFKMVFEMMKGQLENQGLVFKVGKVVPLEEYVKKAGPEREFLMKLPSSQTRVVYVSVDQMGRNDAAGIIVRVIGSRVRVIGIGQPDRNNMN